MSSPTSKKSPSKSRIPKSTSSQSIHQARNITKSLDVYTKFGKSQTSARRNITLTLRALNMDFAKKIIAEEEFERTHAAKIVYYDDKPLGRCGRKVDEIDEAMTKNRHHFSWKQLPRDTSIEEEMMRKWNENIPASKLVFLPDKGFREDGYQAQRESFRVILEGSIQRGMDILKGYPIGKVPGHDLSTIGEEDKIRYIRVPLPDAEMPWYTGMTGEELRAKYTVVDEMPPQLFDNMPAFFQDMYLERKKRDAEERLARDRAKKYILRIFRHDERMHLVHSASRNKSVFPSTITQDCLLCPFIRQHLIAYNSRIGPYHDKPFHKNLTVLSISESGHAEVF
ncbi:hypothetical protein HYALB_00011508 [Hymenoscyphus albidus]|uniref:Uncharacterized protein n=1 Tax=Hymenoscyphus albidus TaxID=595503 RepID=A0A9N9LSK5_9HELO|nr:hypothetical protein HYALB_00011508 [Hymenoscyphus albidus]